MRRVCAQLRAWGVVPEKAPGDVPAVVDAENCECFLGQCLDAWENGRDLLLLGADWPAADRREGIVLVARFLRGAEAEGLRRAHGPLVFMSTGGSSGQRRFAIHSTATLLSSAEAFVERFGREAAAAWNVLPLHHVGGLMSVLRAAVAGVPWSSGYYRELFQPGLRPLMRSSLSLVPTQLKRVLESPEAVASLRSFGQIFVGGAALDEGLAEKARQWNLPLAPCYGMTETAAMVTALDPERFLAGERGCGTALPHARIRFGGEAAEPDEPRRVLIHASSVALGYLPGGSFERDPFVTADLGYPAGDGGICITGRADRTILSGGENVDPERVAAAMRSSLGPGAEVHVFGVPDVDWGQRVVAFVAHAEEALLRQKGWQAKLAPAERPKDVLQLAEIPRTLMGKLDTRRMRALWEESRQG